MVQYILKCIILLKEGEILKKIVGIIIALIFIVGLSGCGKEKESEILTLKSKNLVVTENGDFVIKGTAPTGTTITINNSPITLTRDEDDNFSESIHIKAPLEDALLVATDMKGNKKEFKLKLDSSKFKDKINAGLQESSAQKALEEGQAASQQSSIDEEKARKNQEIASKLPELQNNLQQVIDASGGYVTNILSTGGNYDSVDVYINQDVKYETEQNKQEVIDTVGVKLQELITNSLKPENPPLITFVYDSTKEKMGGNSAFHPERFKLKK